MTRHLTTNPGVEPSSNQRSVYARAYIASTAGPRCAAAASDEMLLKVFRALSRAEEAETTHRDRWGNWDWPFGEAHRRGELYRPFVDDMVRSILGDPDDPPTWPDAAPFALCLSHDLDDIASGYGYRQAAHIIRDQTRASGPRLGRAVRIARVAKRTVVAPRVSRVPALHRWLDVEQNLGFRSTVFVVAPRLARPHLWDVHYAPADSIAHRHGPSALGDVLIEAATDGWDIGLHGSIASSSTPGLLGDERHQVEDIVQRPVTTTRQHFLRFDIRVTPALQAAAGLLTDSTLGFNRGVGFRSGSAFPHWLWNWQADKPETVLEIPQHVMDGGLFTANALEYSHDLAISHVIKLMDAVQEVGGCLTLSWHPNADPAWWQVYPEILQEAKHRGAWGCSVAQLSDHWRNTRVSNASRI